ncbi:MAG: hypothetical protein A3F11_02885 [Gammaproteobacteria bacterium RIFCSPHIGHO2_12_FULL_37_14]|nr:MAG: hypothetical protein A3F11_02885 [Gammaproteobacteria bacterium RIFCSPHIGHO2_12_FULL_37_14]
MRKIGWGFFLFFISQIPSAYAYIDPGTGSMLLQGLIAGIAAGLGLFFTYFKKIKKFLASIVLIIIKKQIVGVNSSDSVQGKK